MYVLISKVTVVVNVHIASIGPTCDDDLDFNLLQAIDRYAEGVSGAGLETACYADIVLRFIALGWSSIAEVLTQVEIDGVRLCRYGEHLAAAQGGGLAVVHALVGVEAYGIVLLIADDVALGIAEVVAVVKVDGVLLHRCAILL